MDLLEHLVQPVMEGMVVMVVMETAHRLTVV
jgi:hypothetical protein